VISGVTSWLPYAHSQVTLWCFQWEDA
jgi:hypothetical protein